MIEKIYVVSLDAVHRRDSGNTAAMHRLLAQTDGVEIIEGAGRKTTKVRMSPAKKESLKQELPGLTFSVYEDFDLLAR